MHTLAYFGLACQKVLYRLIVPMLYKDKKVRKAHLKAWTTKAEKRYLERYLYVIDEQELPTKDCPKTIWVCWLQGLQNAPEVVQRCVESLYKHCDEFKINIVTLDNVKQYVDMPDYIYQKYNQGKISHTQFSDLLRLALLSKQGGYWIDATVFLTQSIPVEILDAEFFAYHCKGYLKNNSWFLKASVNDLIIRNMKNLMFEYWKYENRLVNYFLYHLFFDLMMEKNAVLAEKWSKVPVLYDDCYELEYNFFTLYSEDFWKQMNAKTTIHKLSYRYKKNKSLDGTFLEKFL